MNMDRTHIRIDTGAGAVMRLLTWLSPAFPVGAYSYSHGIEYVVEAGFVRNADTLGTWVDGILRFGAGRNDGIFLVAAYRAAAAADGALLTEIATLSAALRGTRETALESTAQGSAFLKAITAGWPALAATTAVKELGRVEAISYPVAVGTVAAVATIDEATVLEAYLTALVANLISAGVRLVPLGQSDGLRVIAELEPRVRDYAAHLRRLSRDDLGGSALAVDWSSMHHETQYTRLFRS